MHPNQDFNDLYCKVLRLESRLHVVEEQMKSFNESQTSVSKTIHDKLLKHVADSIQTLDKKIESMTTNLSLRNDIDLSRLSDPITASIKSLAERLDMIESRLHQRIGEGKIT